jgi:glycosyl transferase family 25
MSDYKIVLLILNCQKYKYKADYQKITWLRYLPNNITYYHIVGNPELESEYIIKDNLITIKCPDDYCSLTKKIIIALDIINTNIEYDYIYKTDDDQILINNSLWIHLENVIGSCNYGGYVIRCQRHISKYNSIRTELPNNILLEETLYCNGRFYFLSKNSVKNLLKKKFQIMERIIEDHTIGYFLDDDLKKKAYNFNNFLYFMDLENYRLNFRTATDLLKNIYYINLDSRTDRNTSCLKQLNKITDKLNITPIRFSAIKNENGYIGCSTSHLECVKIAKNLNLDYICICEDDINILNSETLLNKLETFMYDKLDWDVIIVSGNNFKPFVQINNDYIKISNCQCATMYIVNRHYYDKLINNIETSINLLKANPELTDMYAIDQYWKRLQAIDKWFMIIPTQVVQLVGYSDIVNRRVNYKSLYNYDK